MKLPNESYLPSSFSHGDVPLITFQLSTSLTNQHDDSSISTAFLKSIGCRMCDVSQMVKTGDRRRSHLPAHGASMKEMILSLVAERSNMSENDLRALREQKIPPRFDEGERLFLLPLIFIVPFVGRTLRSSQANQELYAPHELHFPAVAEQLQWPSLLIIDWIDIERYSPEYVFLKELGVRQAPELTALLDRIVAQYHSTHEFHICRELRFFAEHFQMEYSSAADLKKCQRRFLPSTWPFGDDGQVVLMSPNQTFTGFCCAVHSIMSFSPFYIQNTVHCARC